MNEDLKILKTIVKICHNYLQKGEEIDFVINERHLQAIENVLEERKKDKTKLKELENKLKDINAYILTNGIDEHLKTATQIQVENQQQYIIQEKINLLKKKLENSIPKQKVKETLDDIYDYFESLNVPDEDIEYIESKRKELLEEGD